MTLSPDRIPDASVVDLFCGAGGLSYGFKSEAYWRPVDSMKDLAEATRDLVG